jgi:hypothetical protein
MPTVPRNVSLDRTVRDRARDGQADAVLSLLGRTRGLTPAYASLLKSDAAMALFQAIHTVDRDRLAETLSDAADREALGHRHADGHRVAAESALDRAHRAVEVGARDLDCGVQL